MDDLMTTQEVARLAGVGATAVKRWSDAQILQAVRTVGGHRRFRRADVEAFLRARGAAAPPEEGTGWADTLLRAEDAIAVQGLLLGERSRCGSWARVADLVGEALVELGTRWASGALTIGEEHLASERLARALARTVEAMPGDPGAPRALLLCAEGDDHTLGLAMAELVLREAGWRTRWSGRATPRAELAALLAPGTELVAVSGSAASSDPLSLARLAKELGELCAPRGVALVLGGEAAWPEHPPYGRRLRSMEALAQLAREERGRVSRRRGGP